MPNDPFVALFGIFLGLTIGSPVLALYVFMAFRWGQRLADRLARPPKLAWMMAAISLAWMPVIALGWVLPLNALAQATLGIIFYLLNAYPYAIGYTARRGQIEDEEKKRFGRNVDEWLSEWECEPATHVGEADFDSLLGRWDDDSRLD